MIDPTRVTDYDRSLPELEEFALFAVLVAGKPARRIAPALAAILADAHQQAGLQPPQPFEALRCVGGHERLAELLRRHGVGCFNQKAATLQQLIFSGLDLRTCSVRKLEAMRGIGPKTARFFLVHSRPGLRLAVLDVHVLRYLRGRGYATPQQTPSSRRRYRELEEVVLRLAHEAGLTPAEFDIWIWTEAQKKKGSR